MWVNNNLYSTVLERSTGHRFKQAFSTRKRIYDNKTPSSETWAMRHSNERKIQHLLLRFHSLFWRKMFTQTLGKVKDFNKVTSLYAHRRLVKVLKVDYVLRIITAEKLDWSEALTPSAIHHYCSDEQCTPAQGSVRRIYLLVSLTTVLVLFHAGRASGSAKASRKAFLKDARACWYVCGSRETYACRVAPSAAAVTLFIQIRWCFVISVPFWHETDPVPTCYICRQHIHIKLFYWSTPKLHMHTVRT